MSQIILYAEYPYADGHYAECGGTLKTVALGAKEYRQRYNFPNLRNFVDFKTSIILIHDIRGHNL